MKLQHGDCIELLKRIDDETADLVLTDPPYNIGEFMQARAAGIHRMRDNFFVTAGWDNDSVDGWRTLMDAFFKESARVLKKGGSLVVFMAVIKVGEIIEIAQRNGFYYKTTGTWHKTNPMPRNMNLHYINSTESWVYFVRGKKTGVFNNEGKALHDFIETSVTPKSERAFGKHPTQKPVALMEHFVKTLTNPGDLVIDPFMGSGTTGVACNALERNFVGFEINEEYYEISKKRMQR